MDLIWSRPLALLMFQQVSRTSVDTVSLKNLNCARKEKCPISALALSTSEKYFCIEVYTQFKGFLIFLRLYERLKHVLKKCGSKQVLIFMRFLKENGISLSFSSFPTNNFFHTNSQIRVSPKSAGMGRSHGRMKLTFYGPIPLGFGSL